MWILPLVGYIGAIVGFAFLTLAIASGLYYLSEVVEEHTVLAKRLISQLIHGVVVVQLLLWIIDGFPFWLTLLGVGSHVVYLGNMRQFPYIQLTHPLFLTSCALVLINHFAWYRHFSNAQTEAYSNMASIYDTPDDIPSFTEVAAYFGLCVWLVPFALFVSLSASDNVLPTMGSGMGASGSGSGMGNARAGGQKSQGQGMAKALVDSVRESIGGLGAVTGWKKKDEGF